jgi:hypothetical protein
MNRVRNVEMMLRFSATVLTLFAGAAAILAGEKSVAETPTDKPFSITISTEAQSVKAVSEVAIKIRLRNTSNQDLIVTAVYFDGIDGSYTQEVHDKNGNLVEPAVRQGGISLRTAKQILKPGETARGETHISPQYDLSQPGEYVIQLSRPISDDPKDGVVKSNKLKITVTP